MTTILHLILFLLLFLGFSVLGSFLIEFGKWSWRARRHASHPIISVKKEAGHRRIAELNALYFACMHERDRARSELAALQAAQARAEDGTLRSVKLAFAKRFHPDHVRAEGLERQIRAEVFSDFWQVLERLERGGIP